MSTVTGRVLLDIAIPEILTAIGDGTGRFDHVVRRLREFANGTSDSQINKVYSKVETGIGATTTVYDLIGSLTDKDGSTLNFDEVVLIFCLNLGTTATQYLTIGPDATNGFGITASNKGVWAAALGSGGGSVVPADGTSYFLWYCEAGMPAAAGSTDELSVVTTGTGNTWYLLIAGRDNP